MFIVSGIVVIYTLALLVFILPNVAQNIRSLEEKNAKLIQKEVITLVRNFYQDLAMFRRNAIAGHKRELKNLGGTVWSIISAKYDQSKPENIGLILKAHALEFQEILKDIYQRNRDRLSTEALKEKLKEYIRIYRFNNGYG
jgi:hypothetical protein